ncbi:dodecin domain-containing protein [Marinobacterium sp. AK62]|uniref:Dodecin domain-containing protein n=1 Tax=Marinobacterium alkalitolerans TaxID=1542925 RepID=A0ABS3Z8M5_9GAMM|nr:dodecin [Marinobacterium alkalitolerans]MBP0047971.1 dodecin domain-containing protein [Marinobacterium alkalitolerans]
MSDHVYKLIEVAGSSTESHDDAIRNAIAKASESVEHLNWYEVKEMRGHIENGLIAHYQVVLRIGFRLE